MPLDPKKLVALAAKFNGLNTPGLSPWHLKATFTRLDVMGNPIDHGTYEEFWASPTKRKHTFTSTTFTSTTYHDGRQVKSTGPYDVPDLIGLMRRGFVDPLPGIKDSLTFSLIKPKDNAGNDHLSCVALQFLSPFPPVQNTATIIPELSSTLCFDADRPLLRVTADFFGLQILHNNVILFEGHYLPRDLLIVQSGKVELKAHIESIEELKTFNENDFVAPHDAVNPKHFGILDLPQESVHKLLIRSVEPEYPAGALAAHIFGSVHVRATIGIDGKLRDLHVLDGPLQLQQAALDALAKYQFKTYYEDSREYYVGTVFQIDFPDPATKK
jgi:hypothetical protein